MSHQAIPPQPTEPHATGHETRDVNIRKIGWLVAFLAGMLLVVHVTLYVALIYFADRAEEQDPPVSPLAEAERVPPGPRLQATPVRDYILFRRAQEEQLESYGWVDRDQKIVHIPIERAIELLAQRGLPTPDPAKAAGPENRPANQAEGSSEPLGTSDPSGANAPPGSQTSPEQSESESPKSAPPAENPRAAESQP